MLFTNEEYALNPSTGPGNAWYDLLPGDGGFVMTQTGVIPTEFKVVQNWFEELKGPVPN